MNSEKDILIEIKDIYSNVLYSHSCENNTFLHTLTLAVYDGVFLPWADVRNADLEGACLDYAMMPNADFTGANLKRASFKWANLKECVFNSANMEGVFLKWSDCEYASFVDATLNKASFNDTYIKDIVLW